VEDLAPGAGGSVIPAEVLAAVPGCEDGRPPLATRQLPGRGRNEVLRIDTTQGRFVWRRRHPPVDRPGSLALTELRAHRMAASAGLAPALVSQHPAGRWLLMEFIDAAPWTEADLLSPASVDRLGERLAELHALQPPTGLSALDPPAIAYGYFAQLGPAEQIELAPLVAKVEALSEELAGRGAPLVLNHGDPAVTNLMGPWPMLIDWEYAQLADPGWDLACLATYYPGLAPLLPRLLASAGLAGAMDPGRFDLQLQRFGLLNRLWERVEGQGAG
jgi:aminoglycoside phosphotransferase (APT) family kinase protein